MDIHAFTKSYWYIWFLFILFIIILIILNGFGILIYRKKREKFLNKSNKISKNIEMNELSTINKDQSNYQQISIVSNIINNDLTYKNIRSSHMINFRQRILSIPKITPIPEVLETSQVDSTLSLSNQTNNKSDMDLSLEEFQRQALKEHNVIRTMHNKPPLKLSESLNIYAQYWAEQCAKNNTIVSSRMEWRLNCKGEPLGENIVSVKSIDPFDGAYFTSLIVANDNQSYEVDCILNEITNEVGFGLAQSQLNVETQQQWIGVGHYYPYRQLTTVQS